MTVRAADLGCFGWTDPEAVGGPGPLSGLSTAVKANIWVAGRPADCGSRLLEGWIPPGDARAVARLRAAGARIVAGTRMDEFGMGSSSEHCAFGPVRNPHDLARTPGGSSGGSAAAVAAGLVDLALGSDTGGSVRQPAHCCGVVGLRPTWGRVSRYGLVAFASSLDTIGPLTRTVAENARAYAAIAGHDPADATSLDAPLGEPEAACGGDPTGGVLGVCPELVDGAAAPDVIADHRETLARLGAAGIRTRTVALPPAREQLACYAVLAAAEAASNLARFDGTLAGAPAVGADWDAAVVEHRTRGFGPEVRRRLLAGNLVLSADARRAYHDRAVRSRRAVRRAFLEALSRCDVLALPTAPTGAFRLGERLHDPVAMYEADLFTVGAALAGLPALTVPTGRDGDGLPLSLQLIGRPLAEERLYALGAAVERAWRAS